MNETRLVAFDPGKTTGWARFVCSLENIWYLDDWGTFQDMKFFPEQLLTVNTTIVYERLRTNLPYFDPIGLEVIGVIKWLAMKKGFKVVPQTAGEISGLKRWPELEEVKLRVKPIHAYEAALHGIKYLGVIKVPLAVNHGFQL